LVNITTAGLSTAGGEVFAGIDWGGAFHQICLLDQHGQVLHQQRVHHDVAGFAELDRLLTDHLTGRRLRVAIERAEGLLVEHLHTLKVEIFCVSPKISARARERYRMAAAKSDAFDAFVLADTLRHEHRHWRPLIPPSPLLAELRAVSRDRDRLIVAQQACENRLRAVLEAYHPAPLHLFSSLDRDITLDFLTDYPTPEHAARVGTARMAGFCHRHGYS
jgi:transposase